MLVKDIKKDQADPVDKGLIRVFVYGTLKAGHGNNRLLQLSDAIFLGYDSITGAYRMFDMGAFPAILDAPGKSNQSMKGEVWATGPEGLASLDLLEGNPNFYNRRKLWTDRLNKRAWVYFMNSTFISDEAHEDDAVDNWLWNPKTEEKEFWSKFSVS